MIGRINMPDTANNTKTIAVIFGGRSAEHDVSIITAHIPIMRALEAAGGYTIVPVYIAPDGAWYSDSRMTDLAFFKDTDLDTRIRDMKPVRLLFKNGLHIVHPGIAAKTMSVDVVFPAMHGTFGEDGSLMGLLRMANVPFVGCDLSASAVAMDKALTKQVVAAAGLPVVPDVWFTQHAWQTDRAAIEQRIDALQWPVFVKPVHLGSSIAITKVTDRDALADAVDVALHYDEKVLVEESVEDLIEVTLPILGNSELTFAEIERPLNDTEFFNFEDKYLGGKGEGVNSHYSEIPAQISDTLAERVREYGERVYRVLGCSGIARVDFLIDTKTETVYINEVNTLPGSLYHHNWKQAGVSNIELVTTLIELAEARFADGKMRTHTFRSDIFNKIGDGGKV